MQRMMAAQSIQKELKSEGHIIWGMLRVHALPETGWYAFRCTTCKPG